MPLGTSHIAFQATSTDKQTFGESSDVCIVLFGPSRDDVLLLLFLAFIMTKNIKCYRLVVPET